MPDMFLLLFLIHASIRHYSYFIKKDMETQKDKKVIFSKLHVKSSPDPGFFVSCRGRNIPLLCLTFTWYSNAHQALPDNPIHFSRRGRFKGVQLSSQKLISILALVSMEVILGFFLSQETSTAIVIFTFLFQALKFLPEQSSNHNVLQDCCITSKTFRTPLEVRQ